MPVINRSIQNSIGPFAWLYTAILWAGVWMEIISHGKWQLHNDFSKLYLALMASYAGFAEMAKWAVNVPTNSQDDPMFERVHRGGFFIWLWSAPLLCALLWRVLDQTVPLPGWLEKITIGLVGIFFLKQASRHMRHKEHGVIGKDGAGNEPVEPMLEDQVCRRIAAAPDGMAVSELIAAFPDTSAPTLYRVFDKLVKARRITRTGKPRTPDVRYHASKQ